MDASRLTLPPDLDGFAVVLFGLECQATTIVLRKLLSAGVEVKLLCLPGRATIPLVRTGHRRATLPMAVSQPISVVDIAHSAGVEAWRIGDLNSDEVHDALGKVPAELVVVACYDRLLPAELYTERRFGGVNVHPSILPDKRGPDPLFWVFREDDEIVGSTVHRLTGEFDAGDILAQETVRKPDGATESELDEMLSRLGAYLLLETISRAMSNTLTAQRQPAEAASYAPHPTPSDFVIDRYISARAAFNFIRGISERRHPVLLDVDGRRLPVLDVQSWHPSGEPPASPPNRGQVVEFADGWLVVTLGNERE